MGKTSSSEIKSAVLWFCCALSSCVTLGRLSPALALPKVEKAPGQAWEEIPCMA